MTSGSHAYVAGWLFGKCPGPGLQRGLGLPTSWRPVQRAAALSWLEGDKVVAESLLLLSARWLNW